MKKETLLRVISAAFILIFLSIASTSSVSGADDDIYIRPDGSIDPPTAPIRRNGNVYTLTGDIYDKGIIVEKDDIVIDGNGHTIQGTGIHLSKGLDLSNRKGVTVKNTGVGGFYSGISLDSSQQNTISGNTIFGNTYAIYARESRNNLMFHNNFIGQPNIIYQGRNAWDNGYPSGGNFWSDSYNEDFYSGPYQDGTGSDGIGDWMHDIDEDNFDNYPLMGPFSIFDITTQEGTWYVSVVSNSTISSFAYDPADRAISFYASGNSETLGFCRVRVPHALIEEPRVLVDNQNPLYSNYRLHDDGRHRWIYFSYEHSKQVVIGESLNLPPVVSDPTPYDGEEGVTVDLATLSFKISDPESELMDYYVATDPNVGSFEGFDQSDGRYSIPLSGPLTYSTTYKWRVMVTDGSSWTNVTYRFTTEPAAVNLPPVVSDPNPPDGATGVSTSLSELSFSLEDPDGDLTDYYVTTDPFIGEGSEAGVSDGTYMVSVSGLNPGETYTWRVSVTDGVYWTNVTYSFFTVAHVETYGFEVMYEDTTYHVTILSNSSVSSFSFNQAQKLISFDVTGPGGTHGACDVIVPKELLDSPFEVTVNDRPVDFVLTQNATHNSLYFSYTHSTQTVRIVGTTTVVEPGITKIPEFYVLIFIVAVYAVMAVIIFYHVKRRKKSQE